MYVLVRVSTNSNRFIGYFKNNFGSLTKSSDDSKYFEVNKEKDIETILKKSWNTLRLIFDLEKGTKFIDPIYKVLHETEYKELLFKDLKIDAIRVYGRI